ncbi:unnamed protein product [Blepharisma stoltei]|uniref:Uncharacterized protein n=1 Tax=Blepharisma stoltei TaxID=1481888 RepID=A0AAU9JGX2_9CILI|nr:unnamed protein product [Blepharisma stoltei]
MDNLEVAMLVHVKIALIKIAKTVKTVEVGIIVSNAKRNYPSRMYLELKKRLAVTKDIMLVVIRLHVHSAMIVWIANIVKTAEKGRLASNALIS